MRTKLFFTFSPKALLTLAILSALFFSFSLYVYTEKQIDRANQVRHISYQLADQLRQSSDDQTRMARSYVVTGDARYKQYHQDILDIRDGKIPRPEGYFQAYWDIVLANDYKQLTGSGKTLALLDLMSQSGFTQDEMLHLKQAKAGIDHLATLEFGSINLVEKGGVNLQKNRMKALLMLHDEHYHQMKEKIMLPINAFYAKMNERTLAGIQRAERVAFAFRLIFIIASLWSLYILWRAYIGMQTKLGTSLSEVQAHLRRIGSGDLEANIIVPPNMKHSILNGLAVMQSQLRAYNVERQQLEDAREDALNRLHKIADQERRHRLEQSKFIVMLTHELKNPLAAIKLAVSGLMNSNRADLDYISLMHISAAESDMDAIIDRCIQADKIDQGGLKINLSKFFLLPFVNDIAHILHAQTRLDVVIPDNLLVCSDTMLLRLVISNLLENALKYSPPESRVTIAAMDNFSDLGQSGFIINVCNKVGKAGVPDESRVFERYYRSSAAQRQSGTGLGLWLVKSIVMQMGGQVRYVPLAEKVEFEIWMPSDSHGKDLQEVELQL